MIYISIDIETTGKDPETCDLLSVGAVIEDTKKMLPWEEVPKFYAIVPREHIKGHPVALEMNKELIALIAASHEAGKDHITMLEQHLEGVQNLVCGFIDDNLLGLNFFLWLQDWGVLTHDTREFNVAGKNYDTFDRIVLGRMPGWNSIRARNRSIDPAMVNVDWENDDRLPTMGECMVRSGVPGRVQHHALYDAWDVVQVLRKGYSLGRK